jgi:hypothetical protein
MMDDFRIGSLSPYDPCRDQSPSGPANRKKGKRQPSRPSEQDDSVMLSGEPENSGDDETVEDYYVPRDRTEEPE